jgi:hypothetical protein
MNNDLTFFTIEQGSTLLDRFKKTLKDVKFFDVLVGYFRTSGFYILHVSFESIDKIRGRDIRKWKAQSAGLFFLYIPWHFEIEKYPAVLNHLKQV